MTKIKTIKMTTKTRANKEHTVLSVNITVAGSGLDVFIPTIPKANAADIIAKSKYKKLTKIEREPPFTLMAEATRQIGHTMMSSKALFGRQNKRRSWQNDSKTEVQR